MFFHKIIHNTATTTKKQKQTNKQKNTVQLVLYVNLFLLENVIILLLEIAS